MLFFDSIPHRGSHYSGSERDDRYIRPDYPSSRDSREISSYTRDSDYSRQPPPRSGYDYAPPQPLPQQAPPPSREYRRPSPPREYAREFAPPPRKDYDDYKMRAPPPPAPPSTRGYYPVEEPPYPASTRGYDAPSHPPPVMAPPPARDYVDRGIDRRPVQTDRYAQYPPTSRPRTPPRPPVHARDEYERPPPARLATFQSWL